MNTMQLLCFTEVCANLSFSKAAERLHVSQPTVSHQVKALEEELDATLLDRSTRSVRLTPNGVAFLPYAQEMVELESRSRQRVGGTRRTDDRSLKIGVMDGFEAKLLAPVLRTLHDEDPTFKPVIREASHQALCDMVESGGLDVMLDYKRTARNVDASKVGAAGGTGSSLPPFVPLAELPWCAVCAPDHALLHRGDVEGEDVEDADVAAEPSASDALTCDDLASAGCMTVAEPHRTSPEFVAAQRELVLAKQPDDLLEGASAEATLALATAGVSFAVLPDIPALRRDDLVYLPIEGIDPIALGARVRRGRRPAPVDRFLDLLREQLA